MTREPLCANCHKACAIGQDLPSANCHGNPCARTATSLRDRPGTLPPALLRNPPYSRPAATLLGQDVCAAHTMPTIGGQPFDAKATRSELEAEGLVVAHKKLKKWSDKGFKPRGTTKQVGGTTVYPQL